MAAVKLSLEVEFKTSKEAPSPSVRVFFSVIRVSSMYEVDFNIGN